MAFGQRDTYGTYLNDTFGNFLGNSNPSGVVSTARRRRKSRKNRKVYSRRHHVHAKKARKTTRAKRRSFHSRRSGKVMHTKHGQPYIITASGKARFIKKR